MVGRHMCGEVMDESPIAAVLDATSGCTINDQGIATRYIGNAASILDELGTADFTVPQWNVIPRQGPHDQDDLLALAVKPT